LTVEAHYFGVEENEVGVFGLAWSVTWRELRIIRRIGICPLPDCQSGHSLGDCRFTHRRIEMRH
jgi:hypothetical protein